MHTSGEFIGLVEEFTPPDSTHQFTTHMGVRPNRFMPVDGIINPNFQGVGVGNWVAAYNAAEVLEGGINQAYLTSCLLFLYALGDMSNGASGDIATHTVSERLIIPSFTMEASYFNNSGNQNNSLRLVYSGCKLNNFTLIGQEGKPLAYTLQVSARDIIHNISEVATNANERTWLGFDTTVESGEADNPIDFTFTDDLYYFSGGEIAIYEPNVNNQPEGPLQNATYARIRGFRLSIDNGLQPQFYINNLDAYGTPIVSELLESPRRYQFQIDIHPDDQDIYRLLMQQGYYNQERRGYGIRIRFDRVLRSNFNDDDYIELRMPASTRSAVNRNWNATPFSYTSRGPISGMESFEPVLGCFVVSAPHNRNIANPLIESPVNFLVPSLEVYCQHQEIHLSTDVSIPFGNDDGTVLLACGRSGTTGAAGDIALGILISYNFNAASPTWVAHNQGLSGNALWTRFITLYPSNPNVAYISTEDGLYRNSDVWNSTSSWTQILSLQNVRDVINDQARDIISFGKIEASTVETGLLFCQIIARDSTLGSSNLDRLHFFVFRSTDGGSTWTAAQTGRDSAITTTDKYNVYASHHNANNVWVYTQDIDLGLITSIRLKRSTDKGLSWADLSSYRCYFTMDRYALVPNNNNASDLIGISVGSDISFNAPTDVWSVSANGFSSESFATDPWSVSGSPNTFHSVVNFFINKYDRNRIMVVQGNGVFARSFDGGSTWDETTITDPHSVPAPAYALRGWFSDPNRVYAASNNVGFDVDTNEVTLSTDFGVTWSNKNGNLSTFRTPTDRFGIWDIQPKEDPLAQ